MAQKFYEVHKERPFYGELVEYMTSGPIVAAVLEKDNAGDYDKVSSSVQAGFGVIDSILKADGSGRDLLIQKNGGSAFPITKENVEHPDMYVFQEGRSVFKFAVTNMADVSAEIMAKNNLKGEDVDWLVPHQANLRIIDATANRMGLSKEKVMINIEKYGNTTSGTIPLCIWEWEKKLKKGDNIILAAFGGGFTWGSVYLKWAY